MSEEKFQAEVQKIAAAVERRQKSGRACKVCGGQGWLNFPPGPVAIGAKLPRCEACKGKGYEKN